MFRPASRAELTDAEPRGPDLPRERIRDKVTGEPGTIVTVKIVERLGGDRVSVDCESYTGPLWAGGCRIFIRFVDGQWQYDGDDPDPEHF